MCRTYASLTADSGECAQCEPGFYLATNKTKCENFTGKNPTCGNWCMSCSQTASTPYYDSCNFCFQDFTTAIADSTTCLEANSTGANTGVYKCKLQQSTNC